MRRVNLIVLGVLFASSAFLLSQNQAERNPSSDTPDDAVRRFEIGGQFSDLTLGYHGETNVPKFALGPEFAFNLNRHLALDASWSVMHPRRCATSWSCSGGLESVFGAGARAEARTKHYGLFAYGRPGVIYETAWTESYFYAGPTGTVNETLPSLTDFAADVGGGVEYFGPYRVRTRMELGDLLEYHPCPECVIPRNWTNHLQFSVGLYAAVGKPVAGKPFDADSGRSHRFFDRTNFLLLGVSLLGQSADAITTQRFISRGMQEGDPLWRPFIEQGWSGQIGMGVLENTAQIIVMYRLHKMGHHRIERLIPLGSAFVGGYNGYHNAKTE
jgi:hypothetical protein